MRSVSLLWVLSALILAASASAQVTRRVSVSTVGTQANGQCWLPSISADGRWVAFQTGASTFGPDTDSQDDVYVHDLVTGTTVRASPTLTPGYQHGGRYAPSISGDGRFVAYRSEGFSFPPNPPPPFSDIYVRDRQTGIDERISVDSNEVAANDRSFYADITPDGRFVAFGSEATNLVPGGSNGQFQLYVRDRLAGITDVVSLASDGSQANQGAEAPTVSADGRFVAFHSPSDNLVPGDTNGTTDVFVRDRWLGRTEGVTVQPRGLEVREPSDSAVISADGRYVAFRSRAPNLVPGDTNGFEDLFVRDRLTGATERVSVGPGGMQANHASWMPDVSADGRFVVFASLATNLVPGDTNGVQDVFVRDRLTGSTARVSVSSGGAQANDVSMWPSVSDAGLVAFQSTATDLVPGDTNSWDDCFVRDDRDGSATNSFASSCSPGAGAVIACPCANPPSGPDRGCDNSAGTGGARLQASGNTQLSADGLVFTTSGERASALSLLFQATTFVPGGQVYGQGVRCGGGTLRRLYAKTASGGSIRAPDFAADDPPVSVRSAAMGEPLAPGTTRLYFVGYRDPNVLGGCAPASVFNATQTGSVTWSF